MSIRHAVVGAAGAAVPRGDLIRVRVRVSLDMLVTLVLSAAAIALIVGYQVVGRLGRRGPEERG